MSLKKLITILVCIFICYACSQEIKLSNGHTVFIAENDHVIVKDEDGNILQECFFGDNGFSFKESREFIISLQKIIENDQVAQLSEMMRGNHPMIFTTKIKNAILSQEPYELCARDTGVMTSGGEIWFSHCDNKPGMCIIAINQ